MQWVGEDGDSGEQGTRIFSGCKKYVKGAPWMRWISRTKQPYGFRHFFSDFGMPIECMMPAVISEFFSMCCQKVLIASRIQTSPLVVHVSEQNSHRSGWELELNGSGHLQKES